MDGEYSDMPKVAKALADSLAKRFGRAGAKLFLDPRTTARPVERTGTVQELVVPLAAFCSRLGRAWVSYDPAHPYGMVLKVVGHCSCPNAGCEKACSRYYERPRAVLLLTNVDGQDMAIGGCLSTEAPDNAAHVNALNPPSRSS